MMGIVTELRMVSGLGAFTTYICCDGFAILRGIIFSFSLVYICLLFQATSVIMS